MACFIIGVIIGGALGVFGMAILFNAAEDDHE